MKPRLKRHLSLHGWRSFPRRFLRPKGKLKQFNGEDPYKHMNVQPTQFNSIGRREPMEFKPRGKSGLEIRDLFPLHESPMPLRHEIRDFGIFRAY